MKKKKKGRKSNDLFVTDITDGHAILTNETGLGLKMQHRKGYFVFYNIDILLFFLYLGIYLLMSNLTEMGEIVATL